MPRWVAAPRIPNNPNDPLYQQFLAIPATGTGLNLTSIQLCILFRRSPAERYARASEVFGPPYQNNTSGGLIKSRLRTSSLINNITNQHLQAVGMTRAQIPRFASGGVRQKTNAIPLPQAEFSTGLFDVAWKPLMDGEKFRSYVQNLDISGMVHFGTRTSLKTGTMEVKPLSLTYAGFVGQVRDAVLSLSAFQELPDDCRLRINSIELRYYADPNDADVDDEVDEGADAEEEEYPALTRVTIFPISRKRESRCSVMDVVIGVMTQLPADDYMVVVGLELRE
ncbi:hypothetical protein DL98DRAFT_587124 [Cadophora sp. DSE1049]|nr:hypothetical protein DL98DRAFT_587124 [Cadophora sp. DSE1049]